MAEVTEADREKATQIVESLVGYSRDQFDDDPYEGREMAWVAPIAAALAEERLRAFGDGVRCGMRTAEGNRLSRGHYS